MGYNNGGYISNSDPAFMVPTFEYERIRLDVERIAASRGISAIAFRNLQQATEYRAIYDDILVGLYVELLATKSQPRTITVSARATAWGIVPGRLNYIKAFLFDDLNASIFLKRFAKRFEPEMDVATDSDTDSVTYHEEYYFCPHEDIPDRQRHIEWLIAKESSTRMQSPYAGY